MQAFIPLFQGTAADLPQETSRRIRLHGVSCKISVQYEKNATGDLLSKDNLQFNEFCRKYHIFVDWSSVEVFA